ncbi:MAG: hypothetical protein ACO3GX_12385 [Gemmataceae bacterium]
MNWFRFHVLMFAGIVFSPFISANQASKNPYPLTPDAGTWVVCCASYTGADAPELSRQVAEVLRSRDRLPAFIFNHGEEEKKKQVAEFERWQKLNPTAKNSPKLTRINEQCAVLIGGFKDIDEARKGLEKIKKLAPPELKLENGKETTDVINLYVPLPDKKGVEIRREKVNPFSTSFVVKNPTVALPTSDNKKNDKFLKSLNADEQYSLFKNPKKYTLVVKEYNGSAVIQTSKSGPSGFMEKLFSGNKQGEMLNAAALQAHETARVLRKLDFDAFVLHTKNSSIVTVGAFDSKEDPNLQRVHKAVTSLKIQALDLYNNPLPMEVPH